MDYQGMKQLISAGDINSLQNRLQQGGNANVKLQNETTLLHFASNVDNVGAVELLLKNGARVNAPSWDGSTPIDHARSVGVAKLLIRGGAKVTCRTALENDPVDQYLVSREVTGRTFLYCQVCRDQHFIKNCRLYDDDDNLYSCTKRHPVGLNDGDKADIELPGSRRLVLQANMSNMELTDEDAFALAHELATNTVLTKLDFSRNSIGDSGIIAISYALLWNKSIKKLSVGHNRFGPEGAVALGKMLKRNENIEAVTVTKSELTVQDLKGGVTGFGLYNRTLKDIDIIVVAMLIKSNEILTKLVLSGNEIGPEGATALATGLHKNNSLKYLNLNKNNIGDPGAKALGEALSVNKILEYLFLKRNKIGDDGAKALGEGLKNNSTLQKLDLEYNKIRNLGASALGEALQNNSTLIYLSLWTNNIGPAGAESLATMLKVNTTLKDLDLSWNKIGDEGATALGKALESNSTLKELLLYGNNVDTRTKKDLKAQHGDRIGIEIRRGIK